LIRATPTKTSRHLRFLGARDRAHRIPATARTGSTARFKFLIRSSNSVAGDV
jgi:hypothetical protein